jgi:hypothetical protein
VERLSGIKIATLGTITALLLTACHGGGFSPSQELSGIGPTLTGGKTDEGFSVTTASDDGEIEKLKSRISDTAENVNLAAAIIGLNVTLADRNGKNVSANPERLKIEIYLKPGIANKQTLSFDAALTRQAQHKMFRNVNAEEKESFRLSGACGADDCKKVVLRLEKTGVIGATAESGLIYRARSVKGSGNEDPADLGTAAHLREINNSLQSNKVDGSLQTMEVVYGLSNFKMEITTLKQKLCVTGRFVLTTDHDERVNISSCDGQNPNIVATMIGNDGGGTVALRLEEDGSNLSLLLIADDDDLLNPDAGGPANPPIKISGNIRLPVDQNDPVTTALNKDRNRKEVKSRMQAVWLTRGLDDIKQWLIRIQPNLPTLTSGLNAHGVPNQFIVITLTESTFFKEPGYPVQVSSAKTSTATGPWQFVGSTAPEVGLKIFPNKLIRVEGKGASARYRREYDKCDERAYLRESTIAAGKYFARFLRAFKDPKVAVLAYHDGPGRTDDLLDAAKKCTGNKKCKQERKLSAERLKAIKNMNLDFWKIHALGMIGPVSSNYVIDFVAANLIAQNPGEYGVTPPSYEAIGSPGPAPVKPASCN